mmetsp:Transcript_23338/g.83382  ORF Transcript_23338/g.83382 Transcript_23338/m.83382 type:complete len:151 (-) Transcript_23338:106-558(-)
MHQSPSEAPPTVMSMLYGDALFAQQKRPRAGSAHFAEAHVVTPTMKQWNAPRVEYFSLGAPAVACCAECGDGVRGDDRLRCRGRKCGALVCDLCDAQSRNGALRALAPRLRDRDAAEGLVDVFPLEAQHRICEGCLDKIERALDARAREA